MDVTSQIQGSNGIYIPLQDQSFQNNQMNQVQRPANQPIIQGQVIMNQLGQPKTIYVDVTNFKTSPHNTVCPICNNQITTQVNKTCNWYSWLLFCCVGILPWITMQACRNKKLNCYNADHICPRCGNKIAEYNSC